MLPAPDEGSLETFYSITFNQPLLAWIALSFKRYRTIGSTINRDLETLKRWEKGDETSQEVRGDVSRTEASGL